MPWECRCKPAGSVQHLNDPSFGRRDLFLRQFVDWIDILVRLHYARAMVGTQAGAAAPVGAELHLGRRPRRLAIIFVIVIGLATDVRTVVRGIIDDYLREFKPDTRQKFFPSHHSLNTAQNPDLIGRGEQSVDWRMAGTISQVFRPFVSINQYEKRTACGP